MAPKIPEKQHARQQDQLKLHNNAITTKHSNPFHISASTLCHNKRLKQKRSKYGEYLRSAYHNNSNNKRSIKQQTSHKTDVRRQKLNSLKAKVTIDLISDDEEETREKFNSEKPTVIANTESMSVERAAILGLMPIARLVNPPPLIAISTNHQELPNKPAQIQIVTPQKQNLQQQPVLIVPAPKQMPQQPRKRKSKPQKRRSAPACTKTPILLNTEAIVLSDDSNDDVSIITPSETLPQSFVGILQSSELSITSPTSTQTPRLPEPNSIQVDEEVTISLVPRSLNATSCASHTSPNSSNSGSINQAVFPMLPDETTVHTVIANRIYELSLTKLREGLASCGIPEFADGQQKISPPRRKGLVQQPPVVTPPQAPISLKLSSDLSISLISDDEDDVRQNNCHQEPILSPAFLQKLPVNVSIAPVPMVAPRSNRTTESRKLKLG